MAFQGVGGDAPITSSLTPLEEITLTVTVTVTVTLTLTLTLTPLEKVIVTLIRTMPNPLTVQCAF